MARDLSDVMGELREASAEMTAQQKSQIANTIAGSDAQKGLLAILNASQEDYDKLADAINNADGAAAGMSETMMDNLQGTLTLLQSAADGVKISFGERLSPYVRSLADWMAGQMPALEQGLDEFMDWIDTRIGRIQRKFRDLTKTGEWQNADFLGKVTIAWDEFIGEPFTEWWNGSGKAKLAGTAQEMGSGIGTGLKVGVMTLLGIDLGETVDEGVSIGASFAKGFSDGFDFQAVSEKLWQGFGNLVSNAGKLLPGGEAADLSSVLSAVMVGKIAAPLVSVGRGAASLGKGLFGTNPATGTSLMGSFLGSAASGTGLLGKSGTLAINLGAGNLAGGASMGAGALSATGMAAGGGAIAAGATLVSSVMDAYKAIRSDDAAESKAYGESAGWKAGGVAAGAAAGAAIGSAIPGLGTAIGALVGAGVGGIGGWIKGNKIKEEYQENVEEMQKEAERAQKVFEATGLSIEDVTFKNEALTQAMNDSTVSAAQFALMFQEECANVAKKAFGDISLSLAEVRDVAGKITFAGMTEDFSEFSRTAAETESALNSLDSSMVKLKRENWKVSLGMELSERDKDGYRKAIEDYLNTSQAFVDDNHYQTTIAFRLLTGGEGDTAGIDSYYGRLKNRIESLGTRLTESMDIALEDGVITLDESAELQNLQEQISNITNKLAGAETDAKMQALQIKYSGSALDMDSFNSLQEELQANVAAASGQYEDALTLTLTNLNLQLADGAITRSEYNQAFAEATEGYYVQINELTTRVSSFNLETIAAAWDSELEGILPEIEGTTARKLSQALNHAMQAHPDIETWTTEDVIGWMGLDKLDLDTAEQTTIAAELIQSALAVPEGLKGTVIQNIRSQMPTLEEVLSQQGPISNERYAELAAEWEAAGASWGTALNSGASQSLMAGAKSHRSSLQSALSAATASPFTISPSVNVMPNYNITAPRLSAFSRGASGHAAGGYVSGGPQLSWLAEEGYGEFVIPTNPSRRARALDLYEQAGAALGVSAHGAGGYVGGSILSDTAAGYNLFGDANRNASIAYNETTEGKYDGGRAWAYEPVPAERESSSGGSSVQVSVSMTPEFVIHGRDGQSEEDIMQVIRKHLKEMADELGGEIAQKLEKVFSNMPLKEA